jgi:PAS domain S-box-containing protein
MNNNLPLKTTLLQFLPVAVYMTDPEGRITYFNEAAERLWGQKPTMGVTQWCDSGKLYWPNGRAMAHAECPMAQTLKRGESVGAMEAVIERPDGSRVRFIPYPTLLTDESGNVSGAINVLVEVSQQRDSELEAARLAAIVSSSDDAIVSKTLDGIVTSWNAAACRIFGYSAEEMIGQHITRIIPLELRTEEEMIISRLHRGERIEHFDTVRVGKNGNKVHLSITVSPIRDSSGRIVGASKVARDVSERKRYEELQRTLFDELNHRVKNTLATVQALSVQTLRGDRSLSEARDLFQGRLMALSATHDHLSHNSWQSASLGTVVGEILRPFGKRVESDGPDVVLTPRQAITWGMVIHELATNAAKYGALSQDAGQVRVSWQLTSPNELEFDWRESGAIAIAPPARKGFGTLFVERASANDLSGKAIFDYRPEGLRVAIRAELG